MKKIIQLDVIPAGYSLGAVKAGEYFHPSQIKTMIAIIKSNLEVDVYLNEVEVW